MKSRKPRAKEAGQLVGVRLQPDLLEKLDRFRQQEEDLPTRPEAVRRILERSLEAGK